MTEAGSMEAFVNRELPPERLEIDAAVDGQTVCSLMLRAVALNPSTPFLRWKDGDDWTTLSFSEAATQVARITSGLQALGLQRGERIALMMKNRVEFHLVDLAVLFAGAVPISIYNSSAPTQVDFVVENSGAVMAITDSEFAGRFKSSGSLRNVVVLDGAGPGQVSYETLLQSEPTDLKAACALIEPGDDATIIYTSGTTAKPKGVRITHYNICWAGESHHRCVKSSMDGFNVVSYLPMAHIAERFTSHYLPLLHGCTITPCANVAVVMDYFKETRPQVVFGVPRIWEKLYSALQHEIDHMKPAQAIIVKLATSTSGSPATRSRRRKFFAPVLSKLRTATGLDRIAYAVTGAAPIAPIIIEWFQSAGVVLSDIYGMSESTGPIAWSPFDHRFGTVGRAIPGCEVELLEDGEIIVRGGNISPGYLNDPERTAESFDRGWLKTGDIGEIDADGYLSIVDRKKDLIITAGGKNISPANLETALKSHPLIAHAVAIGEARPCVVALIILDAEATKGWGEREIAAALKQHIETVNGALNSAEQIKNYLVITDEWQADSEELTPTLKLKRKAINEKYNKEIDALYQR